MGFHVVEKDQPPETFSARLWKALSGFNTWGRGSPQPGIEVQYSTNAEVSIHGGVEAPNHR